ncbi:MAG: hydrogenase maturation nickel metallochaperone HypA [Candidatus Omnitrophota bacterium]
MHDMHFASRIAVLLKEKIGNKQDCKGVKVNIILGPFTHVTPESLRSAFTLLNENEGFKNVLLDIRKNKPGIKCNKCHKAAEIAAPVASCPACGASDFELLNNEEFIIESIEIEQA